LLRRLLPLIPAGLLVQQVLPEPDRVVILSRPTAAASVCPLCGKASARVHSHYQRHLADLPWQGRVVVLRVQVRRFRCRELRRAGFRGGLRVVTEWATRRRLAGRPGRSALSIIAPPLRRVARWLTSEASALSTEERHYLDRLLAISAPLARARELALRFAAIVRERKTGDLDGWLVEAAESELRSFASGLKQDEAAVRTTLAPRVRSPSSS
jgi:transposase